VQIISLAGWVNIMYYVQDAHSFWDWIYFTALIVVSWTLDPACCDRSRFRRANSFGHADLHTVWAKKPDIFTFHISKVFSFYLD